MICGSSRAGYRRNTNLAGQYPLFYKDVEKQKYEQIRSENSITGYFYRIRTVVKWCIKRGLTRNNPFRPVPDSPTDVRRPLLPDPRRAGQGVLCRPERSWGPTHPVYRDIFMFQCLIGCRVSDLNRLTKANVVDGCRGVYPAEDQDGTRQYSAECRSTKRHGTYWRRYKDSGETHLLPRFSHFGYNKKIKEILKYVGIDRKVRVLDPKTREDVARPLYEVASTHTARKTFIGNLYRQVKDPNLIASMSGHSEGSRAFARYRKIDDEMKKELVNLLD